MGETIVGVNIQIPKLSLIVLIGPSGSGKSTFARKHFLPSEVLSSDYCRGLVSDNENEQSATGDAFEVLNFVAAKRLARGRLTVVDATNVQFEARSPLVQLARKYHCLPVAIVFDLPEKICHERNRNRDDRMFGPHVIRQQKSQLRRSLGRLKREGFRHTFVMETVEEVESAAIERVPLWNDRTNEHGPFDIIGDVHGCADELEKLLAATRLRSSACRPGRSALGQCSLPTSRRAQGDLCRRSGGPGTAESRLRANGPQHGRVRFGLVRARQSRHEIAQEARWAEM